MAEGIDPTTGELLALDNVCNKGEVVRAFYTVISVLEKKDRANVPANAGKPWLEDEDALLQELFESGLSQKEIANKLGRTRGSISSRLKKVGIIND